MLADHIQCHYKLSCDRLRSVLRPLLTHWHEESSPTSSHHIDHYLQSQISPSPTGSDQDTKITEAYEVLFLLCSLFRQGFYLLVHSPVRRTLDFCWFSSVRLIGIELLQRKLSLCHRTA